MLQQTISYSKKTKCADFFSNKRFFFKLAWLMPLCPSPLWGPPPLRRWRVNFSVVAVWGKMFGQGEAATAEQKRKRRRERWCQALTFTSGEVLKWRRCYNILHISWNRGFWFFFTPLPPLKCTWTKQRHIKQIRHFKSVIWMCFPFEGFMLAGATKQVRLWEQK